MFLNRYMFTILFFSFLLLTYNPIITNAGYEGNGEPAFFIQRGYPFRSAVSELQMIIF